MRPSAMPERRVSTIETCRRSDSSVLGAGETAFSGQAGTARHASFRMVLGNPPHCRWVQYRPALGTACQSWVSGNFFVIPLVAGRLSQRAHVTSVTPAAASRTCWVPGLRPSPASISSGVTSRRSFGNRGRPPGRCTLLTRERWNDS
jgi:hypothetical protein